MSFTGLNPVSLAIDATKAGSVASSVETAGAEVARQATLVASADLLGGFDGRASAIGEVTPLSLGHDGLPVDMKSVQR